MIDTVLNLVFRCAHRRLTRPVTPVTKGDASHGETYVVCLDCGKQFAYDLKEMRVGKPIGRPNGKPHNGTAHNGKTRNGKSHDSKPRDHKTVKAALWASLPVAILIGSVLKSRKHADQEETHAGTHRP